VKFPNPFRAGLGRPAAWALALATAAIFVWFATLRLDAQGAYYDELDQAKGAFAYVHPDRTYPAALRVGGLPAMNMTYSAAIKTGLYGLYLRATGARFSMTEWRMAGILLVAAGLVAFFPLARRGLSPAGAGAFALLTLSDVAVLLVSRFDWGPAALALLLRLAMLGTYLRGEARGEPRPGNSFLLAFFAAMACFEKLSSVVLVGPLALMMTMSPARRTLRHWRACVLGGLVGALPLIAVNAATWWHSGSPISLRDVAHVRAMSPADIGRYAVDYLSLGGGGKLRSLILGDSTGAARAAEAGVVGAAMAALLLAGLLRGRRDPHLRMAGVLAGSYLAVGVLLPLLPQNTWVHHWILGTPFQYAAIAAALALPVGAARRAWASRAVLAAVVLLCVGLRADGLVRTRDSLLRGEASAGWDPSLTAAGEFAARAAGRATFLAADWGVASQILCLSDGDTSLVHELFWGYRGPDDIRDCIDRAGVDAFYVVTKKPPTTVHPENTRRIVRDAAELSGWRETPVEPEVSDLPAVGFRKFVRAAPETTSRP